MHAVIVNVTVDPSVDRQSMEEDLRGVVAGVSKRPGYVSGTWLLPDQTGTAHSLVVFDTEENANAGATNAREMRDSGQVMTGVTMTTIEVHEVAAHV